MLRASQILVRSIALAASAAVLWGCGQRGPLYLPGAPEASQRATLPETLSPVKSGTGSTRHGRTTRFRATVTVQAAAFRYVKRTGQTQT
jgi:hypothetical protein